MFQASAAPPTNAEFLRFWPNPDLPARRADRVKNGVPMPPELIAQLDRFAAEPGVTPLNAR